MSKKTVHVIVEVEALPPHVEALKAGLRQLAQASRHEAGCLAYDVLADTANPARMTITEVWTDAQALAAHRASAHVAAVQTGLQGKLAAAPVIHELTSFS